MSLLELQAFIGLLLVSYVFPKVKFINNLKCSQTWNMNL